jgi:hypothetical protein
MVLLLDILYVIMVVLSREYKEYLLELGVGVGRKKEYQTELKRENE